MKYAAAASMNRPITCLTNTLIGSFGILAPMIGTALAMAVLLLASSSGLGAQETRTAAEWVQDVYHTSYNGGPLDGTPWEQETGPSSERRRVIRGGSYFDPPSRLRVSHRAARKPTEDHRTVGFRCAAD